MKHSKFELVLIAYCAVSGASFAQTIPDAGALMRQTEQMMRQNQMQQAAQNRSALPPVADLNEITTVQVEAFKFSGNHLLSNLQLQSLTASFANRPLNQNDLKHLTDAVSEAYRQIGWIVQAYIPRQDMSKTELRIQVIETIPPSKPVN